VTHMATAPLCWVRSLSVFNVVLPLCIVGRGWWWLDTEGVNKLVWLPQGPTKRTIEQPIVKLPPGTSL